MKLCSKPVLPVALSFLLWTAVAASPMFAQEDRPAPARPGQRGGGPGRGAAGTREFLGLGPAPDAAAAAKGAPVYKQNCGACHGETGRGGQAPSLVRSTVVLHDENDESIGPVIKAGRPQAGMPAFPTLSADDIHNVSQFLKQQIELAANRGTYGQTYGDLRKQVSGNAQQGQAYFAAKCASCHNATGDLAHIGKKFSDASSMQARFLWPSSPGPRKATVTTAGGQSITGNVRSMDDFHIALTDSSGAYHYWPLDAVKVAMDDKLAGHRALLPGYTDADIHNVTAYLVTLQ